MQMPQEQRFFYARTVDVHNTSGRILRRLPQGIRTLIGHEVDTTICTVGIKGDVTGLSLTPEDARQEGEEQLKLRQKYAAWTGFPTHGEIIISVEEF